MTTTWTTLKGIESDSIIKYMLEKSDNFLAEQMLLLNSKHLYNSFEIDSLIQNQKKHIDFFKDKKDVIYFKSIEDLTEKIKYYSKNDKERCEIAYNGKLKYFKLFENTLVTKYIVEKILEVKISNKLTWMK